MMDIYSKITEQFEQGKFSVLVTVVKDSGSTPRGAGAKLLVLEDGSSVGTIGGGSLELNAILEAKEVFSTQRPKLLINTLDGLDVNKEDMICGGETTVFLEPVSPNGLNHLHIFKKVIEIQKRGGRGMLVTSIDPEGWVAGEVPKVFMEETGGTLGSITGVEETSGILTREILRILNEGRTDIVTLKNREGKEFELFLEPILSDPVLFVFGGGHVAECLVPLASMVGFKVEVIDDREEFANKERFSKASNVHCCSFDGAFENLMVNDSSYIVIMTRGHIHDKLVLSQALKADARYLGMIGSRRKVRIIFEKLVEEGVKQEDLDKVYSPIGIKIGSETPEEIAVSVVAELIKVRAGV